jgi:hypothetical protein
MSGREAVDFNFGNSRSRVVQQAIQFIRVVPPYPAAAIPVSEDLDQHQLVTAFIVNNYSTNTSPVFLGPSRDLPAPIEIVPGAAPIFTVFQEGRQAYELQVLIANIASQQAKDLIQIPVITWDLTHWYLRAASGTQEVSVTAFPVPYL